MFKSKSIIAALLACAMAVSLAACGGAASSSTAASASTPAASDASSAPVSSDAASAPASSDASSAASSDAAAPIGDLTAEELAYASQVEALGVEMTNLATLQSEVNASDPASVVAALEKAKKPFQDFAALNAPGRFAPAQEKFKSGCEAMVEYIDLVISASEMKPEDMTEEKQTELMTKMAELITTAQTDLMEGATMVQALNAPADAASSDVASSDASSSKAAA